MARKQKMTAEQGAHIAAAQQSLTNGSAFVVYVPDSGYEVYDREQAAIWSKFVFIEATYVNGKLVATAKAAA